MEITWLGRTCFRIRGREGVVLTDPCPPASGYSLGKPAADVVMLSRAGDPGYSYREGVAGSPRVLDAPGEYEIGGILITAVATTRKDGERNVIFVCELEGIRVCHLGLPTAVPGQAEMDLLKNIDILLMPVGGGNSLAAATAADAMTTIDPRIAIPMNYKTEQETLELDPLDRFVRELGSHPEAQPRLQVSRSGIPSELTVMVLQPKG